MNSARGKKTGERLDVAAPQPPASPEWLAWLPGQLFARVGIADRVGIAVRFRDLRTFHKFILIGSGVAHAYLRVHLQGMQSPIRSPGLWQGKGRVPEMPRQETGTAALGICRVSQRFVEHIACRWSLWIVRRSSRPGRVLAGRHELGRVATAALGCPVCAGAAALGCSSERSSAARLLCRGNFGEGRRKAERVRTEHQEYAPLILSRQQESARHAARAAQAFPFLA